MLKTKLISPDQYVKMPWKNGQGVSTEIFISPQGAVFAENTFLWRISSAKIFQKNTFSKFPGYDRVLTIWDGRGLKLNNLNLEPFQTYAFSGEEHIQCEPLSEEVIDLGIIYNREKCRVKLEVLSSLTAGETHEQELLEGSHFVVGAQGLYQCNDQLIAREQTLWMEGGGLMTLRSQTSSASCFLITIRPL